MFTDLIRRIKAGQQHIDPADAVACAGQDQLQSAVERRAAARRTLCPDADNAETVTPMLPAERTP